MPDLRFQISDFSKWKSEIRNPKSEIWGSLFVVVTGGALLWATYFAPVNAELDWGVWVKLNLLTCLLIPLALIVSLGGVPTEFGLKVGKVKRGLMWTGICFLLMLPVLLFISRWQEFRNYYPVYDAARDSRQALAFYLLTALPYMLAWEFMFRGYLLFGLYPAFGWWAVPLQIIPFGLTHWGKPMPEFLSSFGGGIILCIMALDCDSMLYPFVLHWLIYVTLNVLVVLPP